MPKTVAPAALQARGTRRPLRRPISRTGALVRSITSNRAFVQTLIIFALLFALRVASGPTASVSYVFLALYALLGRRQALEALTLSFVFTQLNENMFPTAAFSEVGRYLVVVGAFASVILRQSTALRTFGGESIILISATFGGFILLHSLLLSVMPAVSFLKGTVWLCVLLTALLAGRGMPDAERQRSAQSMFLILALVVVASLAVSPFPASYLPRTSFLRGVLVHSQALAAVAACVAVWSIFSALAQRRAPLWLLGLGVLSIYVVIETAARTAIIAVGISVLAVVALEVVRGSGASKRLLPGLRLEFVMIIGFAALGMALSQSDMISESLASLLGKGHTYAAGGLLDEYQKSRGMLIDAMWANLGRDPFGGIGFGIASNPSQMDVKTIWGLPIGAAVEKGVTPLAIWEELGLLGIGLFCLWIAGFLKVVFQRDAVRLGVLLVILLINLGEASLMSAGGIGLFQILLLGWVASGSDGNSETASGGRRARMR